MLVPGSVCFLELSYMKVTQIPPPIHGFDIPSLGSVHWSTGSPGAMTHELEEFSLSQQGDWALKLGS